MSRRKADQRYVGRGDETPLVVTTGAERADALFRLGRPHGRAPGEVH